MTKPTRYFKSCPKLCFRPYNPTPNPDFSLNFPGQLIDYGYIQDVEVDSDDEDDEEEGNDGEERAGAGTGGEEAGDGGGTANLGDPSPDGQDKQQGGVAPPPEGNVRGVGEGGEPAERPSPMAHGVPGLVLPTTGSKAGEGGQQPRFGPQRMFMDEVRGRTGGRWGGEGEGEGGRRRGALSGGYTELL